ncbi:prolipoprotein diacylglyceryl transferase [Patescibacteria group bacterium]|nr:prolipoprotein diacylglyceryl transferase [Patescibacteria group bacterium]MBU1016061.1 prolipoprotein diacylglyceryl transferase [Patescibacteria group bacterium]MBU1685467.1 prolipoprotein diacylglyceryl transferase [Patescibacteria group bacterium]MBU1938679.1 prolipoprotein diacylglyceryl transferase [Patescibacteria group bacterium]
MIDPVAFHIGPLAVRWYGLAYAATLLICIWILTILNKKRPVFKDNNQIFDFIFWIFLVGVLLGGRLGYVLFYNLPYYLDHPAKIFALWEGGMSFHGGLIGTAIVAYILARKHKIDLLRMTDLLAVPGGLVTVLSRLANFINRELYGRVIESARWKWMGVDFGDGLLRYPSQLFQSAGAMLLFLILLFIFSRKPKKGVLTCSYLILYGLIRFILEFWRQPDAQIGFLFSFFTLGQLLSLGMVLAGITGFALLKRRA